jgi:hypothetical protein
MSDRRTKVLRYKRRYTESFSKKKSRTANLCGVPTVVLGGDRHLPTPGGFCHAPPPPSHDRHAPASVAAASALAALPLHPLSQENLSASSALDLTMSILFTYVRYAYPRSLSLRSRLPHYSKLNHLVTQASSRHT